MHIGLNTFALSNRLGIAGSGRYILGLAQGLSGMEHEHKITLVCNNDNKQLLPSKRVTKLVEGRLTEIRPTRMVWEHILLGRRVRSIGIDVLHSPVFVSPLLLTSASVITIFDMTWFTHPERHTATKRVYFTCLIPISARRAQRIITISESSKKDIVSILGVSPDRVIVTYPGIDTQQFVPSQCNIAKDTLAKYGIEPPYILYLGKIEPMKNLPKLTAAYERVREHFPNHSLVLAGSKGWHCDDIVALAKRKEGVVLTGYIAENDIPLLYQNATLFIYPSSYEGFGIPLLEAMACGTPVIASNVSSMPEVVGDAGILVNPGDVQEIAQAMQILLGNKPLRDELSARGVARAKQFTWERMAQETLRVYEEAYQDWYCSNTGGRRRR